MRDLLLSNTIRYIFDTANPFEAAMVDTCITQTVKQPMVDEHIVDFYDGTADLSHPIVFTPIQQSMFINAQNSVIFKPTPLNLRIYELYGKKVKELYDKWWSKIETSKKISQNHKELEAYRASLNQAILLYWAVLQREDKDLQRPTTVSTLLCAVPQNGRRIS